MIPIKLSVQGLYSYQGLQEIDFRQLVGSAVFGIFGKVGSGKTSLLEAISFALYGKTERLNGQDNLKYNMMNLKSKELKIDFEFQAGPDQQLYRFIYEARRHPKKHHEVNAGDRRTFVWQNDDWSPIGNEKEDISILTKHIIGLDYDNFKRTIIIPQNQFREFLELTPGDRTKMMNQLFKLDQYDLAGRVSKLSKINDTDLAELRGLLSPLENVTPETIELAESDCHALSEKRDQTVARIDLLEPEKIRLIYLRTQRNTLTVARQELTDWLRHRPEFLRIQQEVDLYQQCRLLFQSSLIQFDKLQSEKRGLLDVEEKARRTVKAITERLPHLQTIHNTARIVYESRGQINDQIEELDTVQEIRTTQNSITLLTKNVAAIENLIVEQKELADQLKASWKKHQALIDNQFGQESNLERLYKIQGWFVIHKPLKKQADDLQRQLHDYDEKVKAIKLRKDQSLMGFPPEWAELTLKTLPEQIERSIEQLRVTEQERAIWHQQTVLKAELLRYANNLTDGVACPLCGSIHHPAKHTVNTEESDVVNSDRSLAKVRQHISDMTELRVTIKGLEIELRSAVDNQKRLIRERGDVMLQLATHEDAFIWPEFTNDQDDVVADAIRKEGDHQKQLREAQGAVRELNGQLDDAGKLLNGRTEQAAQAKVDLAGLNGQMQAQIDSLKYYRLTDVVRLDLTQIADLRESLTQQYTLAKTAFDNVEDKRNKAIKEQATADEHVDGLTNQLVGVNDEIRVLDDTIKKNLTDADLTWEQVKQILDRPIDVEAEKRRIKEYDDRLCGLQNQVSTLEVELTNQPFDPAALATVQEQLKTIRDERDDLNKAIGRAGNVLATLKNQWAEKKAHQKRHDALGLRRQDLKKMDEMFRAQGFVNYVSSVYLKDLCESANERFFKLTNNQLKLELDEKNNFLVRDFLNGGEVRSVKTLSGGQTFQAALSLALALSDNIQHLTKAKQNLFFLDEGFGTLDKDSLQTVFKTLKALRSENRVVGIISHVEELQHEVDNYIRAEATEEGSRIVRSWEM